MQTTHLRLSDEKAGIFGIAGHVGIGHVHSHDGFVQDDSAGFAVVASLMKRALRAETHISHVSGDPSTGTVMVGTAGGGVGKTRARRGVTPVEAELMQRILNEDGIFSHGLAIKAFGRMYGQGVTEAPVALQGAVALAVLDTFKKKAPDRVVATIGSYPGRIDRMAGLVAEVNGTPVSLLLTVNGSEGGIGPDEDNEGNTAFGEKGELMERLCLKRIPTMIIESKAYVPAMADKISDFTFLIRAQEGVDNATVAESLMMAARDFSIPAILSKDSLPVAPNQLSQATARLARKISELGNELEKADSAAEKVRIVADLAKLVSEDAGGVTFMTGSLHGTVRGAGIVPHSAAVLSLLVPTAYRDYWNIPVLDPYDVDRYAQIVTRAVTHLTRDRKKAYDEVEVKF